MRSKRPFVINNCLVHGICNFDCITCSVNKASYRGPKAYQDLAVFSKLLERISEAAAARIRISYLALSGDGEPTLHPALGEILARVDDFKRNWAFRDIPSPEVALVSNGALLRRNKVFDLLQGKPVGLKISFPTIVPDHYGEIVFGDRSKGADQQKTVLQNIEEAFGLTARHALHSFEIHIAPPFHPYVPDDFDLTINELSKIARRANAREMRLVLFPALSNRAGQVGRVTRHKTNWYRWFLREYQHKRLAGVRVRLSLSSEKFYKNIYDFVDLLRAFHYPCIWDGNFFITAHGDSCCCNDQSALEKEGNIMTDSIARLVEIKENRLPGAICRACNQRPETMIGTPYLFFHRLVTKMKLRRYQRGKNWA